MYTTASTFSEDTCECDTPLHKILDFKFSLISSGTFWSTFIKLFLKI